MQYVASWLFQGPVLKWTAVVTGANAFLKLLVGQVDAVETNADVRALVRREIEERLDLHAWLDG